MPLYPLPWVRTTDKSTACIQIQLKVYPLEVLFRVCYAFTDRCYLFLQSDEDDTNVEIWFTRKETGDDLRVVVGDFSNELINQRVRLDIAEETRGIRELIVAQAFAEADLLDRADSLADYHDDPRGIAK